ncbi:MAG: hypothetical protein ABJG82_06145 [Cyclobacteriaceae bacterium]
MAKKKDQNEDPEEDKRDQFEDDEDFGLPDLDYDELEEEADQELEEGEDDLIAPEEDLPEEVEATADDIDSVSDEDLDEDWEKELEEELDEDLKSGSFDEDTETFYEEETFEEFEAESGAGEESVGGSVFGIDESDEKVVAGDDSSAEVSDDFFASSDESEPVAETPPAKSFDPQYSQYLDENKEGKGKFTKTVVIGAILFMVIGGVLYFLYGTTGGSDSEKKVAKVEKKQPPKKVVEKKPEPVVEEPKEEQPVEQANETAQASSVPAGQITTLESNTGKSYVVIASFFDGDMAQDYANELSAEGKSPYVIPPFKDYRYYRVAIAEYDIFSDAAASVESFKMEYGEEVWPLRY